MGVWLKKKCELRKRVISTLGFIDNAALKRIYLEGPHERDQECMPDVKESGCTGLL